MSIIINYVDSATDHQYIVLDYKLNRLRDLMTIDDKEDTYMERFTEIIGIDVWSPLAAQLII